MHNWLYDFNVDSIADRGLNRVTFIPDQMDFVLVEIAGWDIISFTDSGCSHLNICHPLVEEPTISIRIARFVSSSFGTKADPGDIIVDIVRWIELDIFITNTPNVQSVFWLTKVCVDFIIPLWVLSPTIVGKGKIIWISVNKAVNITMVGIVDSVIVLNDKSDVITCLGVISW
jgi:hypothetical protein